LADTDVLPPDVIEHRVVPTHLPGIEHRADSTQFRRHAINYEGVVSDICCHRLENQFPSGFPRGAKNQIGFRCLIGQNLLTS